MKTHIMRFAPQDWRTSKVRARSARTANAELRLVYLEMLFALHEAGGYLPDDDDLLEDSLMLPASAIRPALVVLVRMGALNLEAGRYSNARVLAELAEEKAFRAEQSARGLRGARAKWMASATPEDGERQATATKADGPPPPAPSPTPLPPPPPKATGPVVLVFDHWRKVMAHPDAKLTPERRSRIEARLRDYPPEKLCGAIDGCRASAFHMGDNDKRIRYDDLMLILRNGANVERFLELRPRTQARKPDKCCRCEKSPPGPDGGMCDACVEASAKFFAQHRPGRPEAGA